MKKGFTLIELLVVVLIIGILSAIALPQYEKAVVKSRLSALKSLVHNLSHSAEVYYLANNAYPFSIYELDVNFPTPLSTYQTTPNKANAHMDALYSWGVCFLQSDAHANITCYDSRALISYTHFFEHITGVPSIGIIPGENNCGAKAGTIAEKVCQQETGKQTPVRTTGGIWHYESNINSYIY